MTGVRITVDLPELGPERIPAPELSPAWKNRSDTGRRQCCPMDTYDTDSAGELRAICTCDDGCGCWCLGCRCGEGADDDDW